MSADIFSLLVGILPALSTIGLAAYQLTKSHATVMQAGETTQHAANVVAAAGSALTTAANSASQAHSDLADALPGIIAAGAQSAIKTMKPADQVQAELLSGAVGQIAAALAPAIGKVSGEAGQALNELATAANAADRCAGAR